jgi:hypothetical protein
VDDGTLSYVESPDASGSDAVTPYVVVAMECRRPLALPGRLSLVDTDEVLLGRGSERSHVRMISEGKRHLSVYIPDAWMSSMHVWLRRAVSGWLVEDKGSKNGTFLNGVRVGSEQLLRDGDLIEAGSTLILFRDPQPPLNAPGRDVVLTGAVADPAGFSTLSIPLGVELDAAARIAATDVPVLVQGETGTGKELIAAALHQLSGRKGRFVDVNCGALPDNLVESELFGYRKGAFSGADEDREGLVRRADGGTLFLDEVAELPESSQVALLRVLQQQSVRPVGGSEPVAVDVRVVAATHQDLAARVDAGLFREDLYARLAGHVIALPPLRHRREDTGLLVAALLARVAPDRADSLRFDRTAARALFLYEWPRNVRELEHALRSALALTEGRDISVDHLPRRVRECLDGSEGKNTGEHVDPTYKRLLALLERHSGNISAVARDMNTSRSQVRRLVKRYRLDLESFRS